MGKELSKRHTDFHLSHKTEKLGNLEMKQKSNFVYFVLLVLLSDQGNPFMIHEFPGNKQHL